MYSDILSALTKQIQIVEGALFSKKLLNFTSTFRDVAPHRRTQKHVNN